MGDLVSHFMHVICATLEENNFLTLFLSVTLIISLGIYIYSGILFMFFRIPNAINDYNNFMQCQNEFILV